MKTEPLFFSSLLLNLFFDFWETQDHILGPLVAPSFITGFLLLVPLIFLFHFDNFIALETFIIRYIERILEVRRVYKLGVNKTPFVAKEIFLYLGKSFS